MQYGSHDQYMGGSWLPSDSQFASPTSGGFCIQGGLHLRDLPMGGHLPTGGLHPVGLPTGGVCIQEDLPTGSWTDPSELEKR